METLKRIKSDESDALKRIKSYESDNLKREKIRQIRHTKEGNQNQSKILLL